MSAGGFNLESGRMVDLEIRNGNSGAELEVA